MPAAQRVPVQRLPSASIRKLGARWARWTTRRRGPILWSALLVGIGAALLAARLPLFVSLDDPADGAANAGPALGDRLRELKQQLDAAKNGAEHPMPLVSKDGRLQIVVVRTPFASGEVSRNAPAREAVERAADEAR